MEGGIEGGRRGCTEGKRTMKELEGGVSGRMRVSGKADRRDGFGDDCFR